MYGTGVEKLLFRLRLPLEYPVLQEYYFLLSCTNPTLPPGHTYK